LRGEGIAAKEARQTNCKNGHPLSGSNLYVYPDGRRGCRFCLRIKSRIRKQKLRKQI
jgi:hypothetical protein